MSEFRIKSVDREKREEEGLIALATHPAPMGPT